MIGVEWILACAPNVAPQTIEKVIEVESRGDPLALHINGPLELPRRPVDRADAVRLATAALAQGYSVDLGLMQVNSQNLPALGTTVEQMFNPCTNLRAGAELLSANYAAALKVHGEGQAALRAALSAYNTGDLVRGFLNGYVARYYGGHLPPACAQKRAPPPNPTMAETAIFTRRATQDE